MGELGRDYPVEMAMLAVARARQAKSSNADVFALGIALWKFIETGERTGNEEIENALTADVIDFARLQGITIN